MRELFELPILIGVSVVLAFVMPIWGLVLLSEWTVTKIEEVIDYLA